jgi:uncharacterized repeat protein (TIGR03806 family)
VRLHLDESYPQKLSEWALFTGNGPALRPNSGVLEYDVNTPLFVDYASKLRTIWMPAGKSAMYNASGAFDFPIGTIFSKTFSYKNRDGRERLMETRLLVRMSNGWVGLPYVWNDEQTDAMLDVTAEPIPIRWTNSAGRTYQFDYTVPNVNQCKVCHDSADGAAPLGPTARNLNRTYTYPGGSENQLVHWSKLGYLQGAPAPDRAPRLAVWDDPQTGTVEQRARAYLEVNCAGCHSEGARGAKSGVLLGSDETNPAKLGICKAPVEPARAIGAQLDIIPGKPDDSALLRRMESIDPESRMPDLGRSLAHEEAVALIREWIALMKGGCS